MRVVEIRFDERKLRRWHLELIEGIASLPNTEARLSWKPDGSARQSRFFDALAWFERRSNSLDLPLLDAVDPTGLSRYTKGGRPADLVVDMTSSPSVDDATLVVHFDGVPGISALLGSLRANRLPLVAVLDHSGKALAAGRPGTEQPGLLTAMLSDVLAGTRQLVVGAVAGRKFAAPVLDDSSEAANPEDSPSYQALLARQIFNFFLYTGYRVLYRAPHWRVGWRFVSGHGLLDPDVDNKPWQSLDDDGYHFYADPFPFEHDGRHFLFVEDFDHRSDKAVISVVEIGPDGPKGSPREVLSHDVHLSYPFIFRHGDEILMIPETSSARTVELYRCRRFPDDWELDSTLLRDVQASDVTVFEHAGTWWMTATVRDGGSFSDSLHIWAADDPRGPWTSHRNNPVLVDISSARPAGRVIVEGDRILRPVQDCRYGYGASLRIAEVTLLDGDGFDQKIVKHFTPSQQWPGRRLHTLNLSSGLETIDGSRMVPRFWRRRGD